MIAGNALEQDYSTATVFYLYLIPRGLRIILPVLKALGKKLRVITYMSPFPESESPIDTFHVTSAKHPDAQWPLFLYLIEPDKEEIDGVLTKTEVVEEGEKTQREKEVCAEANGVMSLASENEEKNKNNPDEKDTTATATTASAIVFKLPC